MVKAVQFFKVTSLPAQCVADAVYYVAVLGGTALEYITDSAGNPRQVAGPGNGNGGTVVSGNAVIFPSVASLAGANLTDGQRVTLESYYAGRTLGGGELVWRAGSTAAADGGSVFAPVDGAQGRFFRTSHLLGTFRPEDYGARGDGVTDDYPAWMALTRTVTARGGGTVLGRQGATYYYGQFIDTTRTNGAPSDPWRDIPTFRGFATLRVDLQGATIKSCGNGYRTQGRKLFVGAENIEWWDSPIDSISGLTFAYGQKLILENGKLDGNARTWTRWGIAPTSYRADGYPQGGAHLNEPYHQGINLWGVDDFTIRNMECVDFMTDGIFLSNSEVYGPQGAPQRVTNDTRTLCHRGTLINVKCLRNRRQGLSVVGGRYITAINCDFSDTGHTGQIGPDGKYITDAYGWHEPGAGVDVEPSTWPTNPETTYRVPETTGDLTFLNCRFVNNMNGPFVCTYSAKIHGNIALRNCLIDGRHDWFPDSYVIAAAGVTFDTCEIWLPPNGFLWQDHMAARVEANLGCKVLNSRIHITRELGYINPTRPIPLTIAGNRIYCPDVPNPNGAPIYFLDRANGVYNLGGFKGTRYENNHHYVPYTFTANKQDGDAVALFEGVGVVSNNVWEMTGTRPGDLGPDWTAQLLYYTDLGGGKKAYVTHPRSETYLPHAGAPNGTDFLVSTPGGFKVLSEYTFDASGKSSSYIPFGLDGQTPKGTTVLVFGMVPRDTLIKDIVALYDNNVISGITASLTLYADAPQKASANFAVGQQGLSGKSGFPFTLYAGQTLKLVINYANNGAAYDMAHMSGYLTTEEL